MPGLIRAATYARFADLASVFRPGQGVQTRLRCTKYITTKTTLQTLCHPLSEHTTIANMALIERVTDKLEAPELDDRSYRVIRLPNKLEALLVHDPDTDKASASVNVNVGSFSDADDMPGMAHAVEHLLFMGTEKVGYHGSTQLILTFRSILKKTPTVNTLQPIQAIPTHIQLLRRPITFSKSPLLQTRNHLCTERWIVSPNSLFLPSFFPQPSTVS